MLIRTHALSRLFSIIPLATLIVDLMINFWTWHYGRQSSRTATRRLQMLSSQRQETMVSSISSQATRTGSDADDVLTEINKRSTPGNALGFNRRRVQTGTRAFGIPSFRARRGQDTSHVCMRALQLAENLVASRHTHALT